VKNNKHKDVEEAQKNTKKKRQKRIGRRETEKPVEIERDEDIEIKLRRWTSTYNRGEELKQTKALTDQPARLRPFVFASRFVLLISVHAFSFVFFFYCSSEL